MSEPEILPPDDPDAPPRHGSDAPFTRAAPQPKRDPLPLLFGAGVVVLVAAVIFLWFHPLSPGSQRAAADTRLDQLQQQVDALSKQLTDLSQRPVPQAPDLRPLEQRVAALEGRPVADPKQLGDLGQRLDDVTQQLQGVVAAEAPTAGRIDALSKLQDAATARLDSLGKQEDTVAGRLDALTRQQQQVATLSGRVDALARQQQMLAALSGRVEALDRAQQTQATEMAGRVDALDKRAGDLAERETSAATALGGRVDALSTRLDQVAATQQGATTALAGRLEQQEKQVGTIATQTGGVADRAARLQRIQAASAALQAGRPLGDLPGAPDALTRFRDQPPPTEAALRLSFPSVAVAAERASRPDTSQMPFWQSAQLRAEALLTVRRGDHVLVGDPAAGVIARARSALTAGDLPGAVAALETLQGPAAQAVASWLDQAHALLAARAALAAMAAHA